MSTSLRYSFELFVLSTLVVVPFSTFAADAGESTKEKETEIKSALDELPDADRAAAANQRWCAVLQTNRLGSMGAPVKVVVDGKPIFLCCAGCKKKALADPKATVKAAESHKKVNVALGKLSAADRELAEAQGTCAVMDGSRLGAMGTPVKIVIGGKPVFLCCKSCEEEAQENPKETVEKVAELKKANSTK